MLPAMHTWCGDLVAWSWDSLLFLRRQGQSFCNDDAATLFDFPIY